MRQKTVAELTFNSKLIITNLTIIAGENPAARAVTILLVRCCATAVDGECEQDILIRFQTHWSNIFPSNFKIDLLENSAIDDVVVLSIVLEEVKNKNMSVYSRLRAICSNSNRKFFVFFQRVPQGYIC